MSFLNSTVAQKSTILITGGGTGIGLALAIKLIDLGHTVISTGRRQAVLEEAKLSSPKLIILQGDIGSEAGRISLFEKIIKDFPEVNVLINNAAAADFGAPHFKDATAESWANQKNVIETNVIGTIHLSTLFLPHLVTKPNALIANVTSIVAFIPVAGASIYCASKAALHSFTISLRHQLKDTSVKVVEIIPPSVDTEGARSVGVQGGLEVGLYAQDTIDQLLNGVNEIGYNNDEAKIVRASRDQLDVLFNVFNGVVLAPV